MATLPSLSLFAVAESPDLSHAALDSPLPPRPTRPRGLDTGLNPLLYLLEEEIDEIGSEARLPPPALRLPVRRQVLSPTGLPAASTGTADCSVVFEVPTLPLLGMSPGDDHPGDEGDAGVGALSILGAMEQPNPPQLAGRDEAGMASTTSALLAVERPSPTMRSPCGGAWGGMDPYSLPSAGASTTSVPPDARSLMQRSLPSAAGLPAAIAPTTTPTS